MTGKSQHGLGEECLEFAGINVENYSLERTRKGFLSSFDWSIEMLITVFLHDQFPILHACS
jgi:hypothetical protein